MFAGIARLGLVDLPIEVPPNCGDIHYHGSAQTK